MDFVFPVGTLVLGRTPEGVPVRPACAAHIFEIVAIKEVSWGSGWAYQVRDIVCFDVLPLLDGDFFSQEADPFDIAGAMGEVQATIEHYKDAHARLEQAYLKLCVNAGTAPPDAVTAMVNFD